MLDSASFRNRGGGLVLYRDCSCEGSGDTQLLDDCEYEELDSSLFVSTPSVSRRKEERKLGSRNGPKAS